MAMFNYLSFEGLLNLGVGDFQKNQNELSACKNVQEDRIGILKRVPGYAKANAVQINLGTTNVNFLHSYFQASANSGAGVTYLIAGSNKSTGYTLQYRTTGDWADITNGTIASRADAKVSAITYLDKTFLVGYDATDNAYLTPATITGITYSTADTDVANMPAGRYIVKYRDLPYVLYAKVGSTVYPSRAYYPAAPVNMAIPTGGWNTPLNFEAFGQDDGDEITGGEQAYDKLVVFKTNSMWTYDEENTKKISDIGCDSYKSIKVIGGILYWANRNGIYRWAGDLPQLISGKVQPFIDAIDQTKLGEMVATNHGFEYRLYIGNVTVDSISYTNCWICFDVRREKFYIRSTTHQPLCATKFIESGKERIYFGSNTGYVYKQSTYVDGVDSDDGNEIDYFFITNSLDMGAAQTVKNSQSIYLFTKNCGGMKYIFDVNNKKEFNVSGGQIGSSNISSPEVSVTGNRMAVKFYGKDKNKPFEFEGFVIDVLGIENVEIK